jgi:hypothetical protein
MIFNVIIVVFSLFLLVYWLRYSCLLILRTSPARDYSKQVATANHLNVFEVQAQLPVVATRHSLDALEKMLNRDYRLLVYLMRHAESYNSAGFQIEQIILVWNYRLVTLIYGIAKRLSIPQGAKQLNEMAAIITHFANLMGERAASAS